VFRIRVTVEKRDGSVNTYDVFPTAISDFEEFVKMGLVSAFSEANSRMSNLYYLAWLAEKDSGAVVKTYENYKKELAHVSVEFPKADE
jgi:hypothetical protein